MPSDPELNRAADDLNAAGDEVARARHQRRSQLEALAHFRRVVGGLLTVAEKVALDGAWKMRAGANHSGVPYSLAALCPSSVKIQFSLK